MFPIPFNERHRLQALTSYGVLDTAPEEAFESLARIACRTFSVPIALVSLVDADRQWFKASVGLSVPETSRDVAFCAHAIAGEGTLVVRDAAADPRFEANPLVTGDPAIRFYAGAPLVTAEGFRLGTFCIIDRAPRPEFSAADVAVLQDFARATMKLLEMRRASQEAVGREQESTAAQGARKDAFALVAHEIRAPIATLIGVARAIEARLFGPLSDPRYATFLSALKETAEQVGETTDRMLDLARLGAGEVDLKEDSVGVCHLLDSAKRAVAGAASAKSLTLEVASLCDDLTLSLDSTLASQMLSNLLVNAVKFSPHGGKLSLKALTNDAGAVAIEVSDQGPGIGDEAIATLFDGPKAVGRPSLTASGGTGLGLPLVKLLVERHGGRLLIERGSPCGTTATLLFPSYRVVDDRKAIAQRA